MLFIASERIWPWPSTKKCIPQNFVSFYDDVDGFMKQVNCFVVCKQGSFLFEINYSYNCFLSYIISYTNDKENVSSYKIICHTNDTMYETLSTFLETRDREQLLMSLPHSLQFVQITVIVCIAIICHLHLLFFLLVFIPTDRA